MIQRNGLSYHKIIRRMKYLEKKQIGLDKEFIVIFDRLTQLYKKYPF